MSTILVIYSMKVSRKTRYGLRMMVQLAKNYSRGPVAMSAIAEKEGISEKFLGQIMFALKSALPITSVRGPRGGYSLAEHPSKITVNSVLNVFESAGLVECVTNAGTCRRSSRCNSRAVWVKIDNIVSDSLDAITLADLVSVGTTKRKSVKNERKIKK